jgi:hypothetical protein
MTDTATLPALTLDDIRVAEPDRDNEVAFDASETWIAACAKISDGGYSADDVANVLLTLPPEELDELRQDWIAHCQSTLDHLEGMALWAADIPLARALDRLDPNNVDWPLPYLNAGEACAVLDERDNLRAENARLRALLADSCHHNNEAAQANPTPAPEPRPLRVVIGIEGGMVQGASADGPCDIVVLDYDCNDDNGEEVPQADGSTTTAWRYEVSAIHSPQEAAWVAAVHEALAEDDEP